MSLARNLSTFASNVDANGNLTGLAGEIKMWPTSTAPSGYLVCNGAAVSRTTYAGLYAIIGTSFGNGDGSSTFNLPNYTDRMPIGAGNLYSVAGTGGSKDSIVVSHTHSVTDPGHVHGQVGKVSGSFLYSGGGGNAGVGIPATGTFNTNSATTGISINSAGSSGTDANLPPYLGVYFIIRHV